MLLTTVHGIPNPKYVTLAIAELAQILQCATDMKVLLFVRNPPFNWEN